ncbi:MAG: hypothetical protein KDI90_04945 [Alphaproteobacteria bacterium]|nr:hypothetical protein [Alphaproteobacteria bacterium]MCB9975108.1 hypothetical protein [Rhodospirillales bacterium]
MKRQQELTEKEIERLTAVTTQTRMGYVCLMAPAAGLLLQVVLLLIISPVINIDENLLNPTSIGLLLFIGTGLAYIHMFVIGFPAMLFLEHRKLGTLLNYLFFGFVAGLANELLLWFLSLEVTSVSIQSGIMVAAVSWGIMNIGNRWTDKRYW